MNRDEPEPEVDPTSATVEMIPLEDEPDPDRPTTVLPRLEVELDPDRPTTALPRLERRSPSARPPDHKASTEASKPALARGSAPLPQPRGTRRSVEMLRVDDIKAGSGGRSRKPTR